MQSDQELFAKGLAAYQKVVDLNSMAHKEVYGILRQVLLTEAPDQFVFLDVACGTATASADAVKGTNVGALHRDRHFAAISRGGPESA